MDNDAKSLDDQFAALLEKGNAALADGKRWIPEHEPGVPAALVPRLKQAQECLVLLEAMWPRAPSDAGTITDLGDQQKQSTEFEVAESVRRVGRYEILEEIGRGGMGVVYRAWQTDLKRPVALKMILTGMHAGSHLRHRFRREAELVAQLRHPHIVQVYETGDHGNCPFFSLEFMDGGSLARHIAGQPQPARDAAEIVEVLARAVHFAHEAGVIHRDLKPSNILLQLRTAAKRSDGGQGPADGSAPAAGLCADYYLKVADFGLARHLDDDVTRTGQLVGTPSYMAPEQALSDSRLIGPATDVYGLGTILYELLTGRPPFKGRSNPDTLDQVRNSDPVSPRQRQRSVPRDLERICLKCLEKEPRRRYETALDLVEDLNRFLSGQPVLARPAGRMERSWRWCRRNPAVAGLMGLVAASLLAGTTAATYFAIKATGREQDAIQAKLLSDQRRYDAEIHQVQQAWKDGQVRMARDILAAQIPNEGEPDLRGFEWRYLQRLCNLELRTLRGHEKRIRALAFSPDGRLLASAGDENAILLWDMATGQVAHTLRGHSQPVVSVSFSRNGLLASSTRVQAEEGRRLPGEIKVWDSATAKELFAVEGIGLPVPSVALSADGNRLAFGEAKHASGGTPQPCEVTLWDLISRKELRRFKGHKGAVLCVAFGPDGRRIASGSDDGSLKIWDADSESEIVTYSSPCNVVLAVAFSPDGQQVVSGNYDQSVKVWNATTKNSSDTTTRKDALFSFNGHSEPVSAVAFSPDGRRVASGSWDNRVILWNLATAAAECTLRGHTHPVHAVAFSPDGWRLASAGADQAVKLWDASCAPENMAMKGQFDAGVNCVTFNGDGRFFASGGEDRTVKIWDSSTGVLSGILLGHIRPVTCVAFNPKSGQVASGSLDRTVKIWDTTSAKEILTLRGHKQPVRGVTISADGQKLASAGDDHIVKLWHAASGELIRNLIGHTDAVHTVAFSSDGHWLASGSADMRIKIWNVASGDNLHTLSGHTDHIKCVAFSPDGKSLASASSDSTIKIWDARSERNPFTLRGHTGDVTSLAFSRDGRRLVSGSGDQSVKIWDLETGQEVFSFPRHDGRINGVAISAVDQRIAACGQNGMLAVWDAIPLTPDLADQREALSRLEFLFAKKPALDEVLTDLHTDQVITDSVRQSAENLAGPFWHGKVRAAAALLVERLSAGVWSRSELQKKIGAEAKNRNEVRQEAQSLAERYVESPFILNVSAWNVVREPKKEMPEYQLGLRFAQRAVLLDPEDLNLLTTIGVAQYRVGDHKAAVNALTQSASFHEREEKGVVPADLAFLAMAHQKLGNQDPAQLALQQLREIMLKPQWANQEEARAFLSEAEALLQTQPAPPAK